MYQQVKFGCSILEAILKARIEALKQGDLYVRTAHLFLALGEQRGLAYVALGNIVDVTAFMGRIGFTLAETAVVESASWPQQIEPRLSAHSKSAVEQACIEASGDGSVRAESEHLLVALVQSDGAQVEQACIDFGLTADKVRAEVRRLKLGVVLSDTENTGIRRLRELTGTGNLVEALGEANRRLFEYSEVIALTEALRVANGSATNEEALEKALYALRTANQEGWQTSRPPTPPASVGP